MLGWLSSSIGKTSRPFWTNTPLQYCPDAGKSVLLPPEKTTQRNTSPLAGSSERQDTPLKKKIWFGFVVVYAFTQLADAAIHQFILDQDYKALADLWRPESELKLWFFPLLGLSFSFCFSLLFSKAYRGGGMPEGARYGFVVSMMIVLPQSFADYAVLSIPLTLALKSFLLTSTEYTLAGLLLARVFDALPEFGPQQQPPPVSEN